MEYLREARFPFLRSSAAAAEKNGIDIETLVASPAFEKARERGLARIKDSINTSEVSHAVLTGADYDRLMEVMSYPYARMIVSVVKDRFLFRRYALAEAVHMNELLSKMDAEMKTVPERREYRDTVITVSKELGVNVTDNEGKLRIHFTDFIRFSVRMKSPEWKLVNTELHGGFADLPEQRLHRLLQNALQDKIESEMPLNVPPNIAERLRTDADHIRIMLAEMKGRYAPSGNVSAENFPPCMRTMLASAQNGINLPHSGRFALVSFLHNLGMDSERILALFSESPDFDASKSLYQIRHITGELSGQEYTPPVCSTMKSYGICFNPDSLCEYEWMTHPLTYYRVKTKPREESAKKK